MAQGPVENKEQKQQYEPVIDVAAQPRVKLNTGALMPMVALGTSEGNDKSQVQEATRVALQSGYRHIDTAWTYFTEEVVGKGIAESGVPREEVFITTKLWCCFHREKDVEPACRKSLKNLNTNYIDLYLIHWPISTQQTSPDNFLTDQDVIPDDAQIDVPIEETWRAMEALVEKGLVKAIGLSNYKISTIKHILSFAKIRPAVLQVEGHPFLPQVELREFCKQEGITFVPYMSLGPSRGLLEQYGVMVPILAEDPTINEIAKSSGRTPADVLYRWPIQAGMTGIPKSVTPSRIRSNLQAALNPLPDGAMEKIEKITTRVRYLLGDPVLPPSRRWKGKVPYPTLRDFFEDCVHYEPVVDVDAQPRLKLNTGALMPAVQFGTTAETDKELVQEAVRVALQSGYRALDTAWSDRADMHWSIAIRESGVARSEVFITSKLFNTFHEAHKVEEAAKHTIAWAGAGHIDLFLIHWPISLKAYDPPLQHLEETRVPSEDDQINVPIEETWRAMEALVDKGLVKAIGLSNFKLSTIRHILSFAKIRPAVVQVEAHVFLQQRELKKFCDDEGIVLMAAAVGQAQVQDDPTVTEVAKSVDRAPADVVNRWPVQAGFATSQTSLKPETIRSNLKAALNPVPDSAMEKLGGITKEVRYENGDAVFPKSGKWVGENLPYPTKQSLWED